MKRLILDSQVLIAHLRTRFVRPRARQTRKDARTWARELIAVHDTNAIVTPVYVEVIAGTRDRHEQQLTLVFLDHFRCVDQQTVPPRDWQDAIRLARLVPNDRRPRDFADCLIRAIANRLDYEVRTENRNFPD